MKWLTSQVGSAAVAVGFLVTFSMLPFLAIETGLDPSWRLALNEAATGQVRFGAELAFTYGPLGYLLRPIAEFGTVPDAIAFSVLVHLALWLLAVEAWQRWGTTLGLVTFALMALLGGAVGSSEHDFTAERPLLVLQLLMGASVALEPNGRWRAGKAALFGASVGPFALVKFTLALSALGTLVAALLVAALRHRARGWHAVGPAALGFAAGAALVGVLGFASPADAVAWLRGAIEVASGYSEAMTNGGPVVQLVAALALLAALALAGVAGLRLAWPTAAVALVSLPLAFLAFKHGFVRQDGHVFAFFPLFVILFGALTLFARTRIEVAVFALLGGAAAAAWVAVAPQDVARWDWLWARLSAAPARPAAAFVLDQRSRERTLDGLLSRSERELATQRLPEGWLAQMRGKRVMVVPWELTLCRANGLSCVYPRALQLYSAYTRHLDEWTAGGLAGPERPDYVLASFAEIDGRHPWFGAPATWITILRGYELLVSDAERNLFLLRRRSASPPATEVFGELRPDDEGWYVFDPVPGDWLAAVEMELTALGRLRRLVYRVEPVYAEVEFADGRRDALRMVPATAGSGLLLGNLPVTVPQAQAVLKGGARYPVRRFRVVGAGASSYAVRNVTVHRTPGLFGERAQGAAEPPEMLVLPPDAHRSAEPAMAWVDQIAPIGRMPTDVSGQDVTVTVPLRSSLVVTGWGVDPLQERTAAALFVNVDGHVDVPATYGLERADVARHFGKPGYRLSGYRALVPDALLKKGPHTLRLKVLSRDRSEYRESPQAVRVVAR